MSDNRLSIVFDFANSPFVYKLSVNLFLFVCVISKNMYKHNTTMIVTT